MFFRSLIFSLSMIVASIVITSIGSLFLPFSFKVRYYVIGHFAKVNLWLLEKICGIHYVVEGKENIPDETAIIFCKHQSTWETMALQRIFPPQTFVVKRELLWLPFFGWGLYTLDPIAIDRKAGRNAIRQVVKQGIDRLKRGIWVVIFPEGTRLKPGVRGKYKIGGAILAERSGYPVVPVAHNAGEYWPKGAFLKKPGTIKVVIGPAIDTRNKPADQILAEAEHFIEGQMSRISHI
ncbi:MAG: lysophospholipid acyltransferase family protein [Thiohalophilus sp.]|jgi:1-acyl-sn-glycerol-3-phosphate acyltransferase